MADAITGDGTPSMTNDDVATLQRELTKRKLYDGPENGQWNDDTRKSFDKLLAQVQASGEYKGDQDGLPGRLTRDALRAQGASPKFIKALKALSGDGTFGKAYLDGATEQAAAKEESALVIRAGAARGSVSVDSADMEWTDMYKLLAANPGRMVDVDLTANRDKPQGLQDDAPIKGRMTSAEYVRRVEERSDHNMDKFHAETHKGIGKMMMLMEGKKLTDAQIDMMEAEIRRSAHNVFEGKAQKNSDGDPMKRVGPIADASPEERAAVKKEFADTITKLMEKMKPAQQAPELKGPAPGGSPAQGAWLRPVDLVLGRDSDGNITLGGSTFEQKRMQPKELMEYLLDPRVQHSLLDVGYGRVMEAGAFATGVRTGQFILKGGRDDKALGPGWGLVQVPASASRMWESQQPAQPPQASPQQPAPQQPKSRPSAPVIEV